MPEKLRKLEAHTGFVKGITWDPVGKYFATQVRCLNYNNCERLGANMRYFLHAECLKSDDKTTKIWRVSDWAVEKTISEPYEVAASNTFFRKLRLLNKLTGSHLAMHAKILKKLVTRWKLSGNL